MEYSRGNSFSIRLAFSRLFSLGWQTFTGITLATSGLILRGHSTQPMNEASVMPVKACHPSEKIYVRVQQKLPWMLLKVDYHSSWVKAAILSGNIYFFKIQLISRRRLYFRSCPTRRDVIQEIKIIAWRKLYFPISSWMALFGILYFTCMRI